MQIRFSWQFLAALTIFLVALLVVGRILLRLTAAPALPPLIAADAPATANTSAAATASVATAPPTATGASLAPSSTATAKLAPTPSETLAPTLAFTLAPTATREPTATPQPTTAPTATPAPQALRVVAQGFAQVGATATYAFTLVNPNPDLIARDTRFQVVAYDSAGIVLRTDAGVIALVGPGTQTGAAGGLSLPEGLQVARVEVLLSRSLFVQAVPIPTIGVENIALVEGERPAVTGIVRNPYSQDLENLTMVAIAYDAAGAISGGGSSSIIFIPAGGQAAAEVPVMIGGTPNRVELYPRLDLLLAP